LIEMARADIRMADVARYMTIDVKLTGLKRFQFRMWVVLMLFRIAAWVSPVQIMIDPED